MSYSEVAGRLWLLPRVSDVQMHKATWQLPVYTQAVSGACPFQDPRGTCVFLVQQAILENAARKNYSQFISVTIRPRLKTLSLAIPLSSYLTEHKITGFSLILYIYGYKPGYGVF